MREHKHTSMIRFLAKTFAKRTASFIVLLAVVVQLLHLLSNQAAAANLSDSQKQGIADTVAAYSKAVMASDSNVMTELSLSPKLRAAIAKKFGVAEDDLYRGLIAETAKIMAAAQMEEYNMDVASAQYHEDKNGQPYALIPTSIKMIVNGQRATSKTHTLALYEQEKWWLIRVTDKQVSFLREVYPEFSNVDFPKESMELNNNEQ